MYKKRLLVLSFFCAAVFLSGCGRSMKDPVLRQAELMTRSAARMDAEEFNKHVEAESAELSAIFAANKPDENSKDNLKIVIDKITYCIGYDIDDDSFKKNFSNSEFTVDIKMGIPDYYQLLGSNKTYRNGKDAASRINLNDNQISYPITMKFKKSGDDILLTNPEDLIKLYEYTGYKDINFSGDLSDIIEEATFEGLNDKGIYYNSSSIKLNIKLPEAAKGADYSYTYDIVYEDENGKQSELTKDMNGSIEKSDMITIEYKNSSWLANGKYTVKLRDENGTQTEYSVEAKRLSDQRYKYFIEPDDGVLVFEGSENVVYRIPDTVETKPLDSAETKVFSKAFFKPYDLEYFGLSKDKDLFVFAIHNAYYDKDPFENFMAVNGNVKKGDSIKEMPLKVGDKTLKSCLMSVRSNKDTLYFRAVMIPVPGKKYCHMVYFASLNKDRTAELVKGFEIR